MFCVMNSLNTRYKNSYVGVEIKQLCIQLMDRTAVHYVIEERRTERKMEQKGQVDERDSTLTVFYILMLF